MIGDGNVDRTNPFNNGSWTITRGLRSISSVDPTNHSNYNEQYQDILPEHEGKDLVQILNILATRDEGGRWLDLGCGAGMALLEARESFPSSKLEIVGIGHPDDVKTNLADNPRGTMTGPTELEFQKNEIDFIPVDFTKLNPQDIGQFDLVTAVYSVDWMNEPRWETIKRVWKMLRTGGIAMIAPFDDCNVYDTIGYKNGRSMWPELEKYGIVINRSRGGIVFQKNEEELPDVFTPIPFSNTAYVVFPTGSESK